MTKSSMTMYIARCLGRVTSDNNDLRTETRSNCNGATFESFSVIVRES